MPVLGFEDFADITDNGRKIEPRHNRKVGISVDKSFLYINSNAFVTGCAGFSGAILMSAGTEMYWGDGQGYGVTGVQGPTGAFGGPPGETGLQGIQGFTGSTGDTGSQGLQGATGLVGATGLMNATGIQGQTGAQGYTGIRGIQGLQGSIGFTGAQGYTGVQGETGVQGMTGAQGYTGSQGETGVQGETGIMGPVDGALNLHIKSRYISVYVKPNDYYVAEMPFNFALRSWYILNDVAGSIQIQVSKASYNDYPTFTGLHSSGGGPKTTLANKASGGVSGWYGYTGSTGDLLKFNIDSATGLQSCTLAIKYDRL